MESSSYYIFLIKFLLFPFFENCFILLNRFMVVRENRLLSNNATFRVGHDRGAQIFMLMINVVSNIGQLCYL